MTEGPGGVTGPMADTPAGPRSAFPVRLLAVGAAVVLLADAPPTVALFTRGDVLRGVLLPFLGATAGALALLQPGREGPRGRVALLLALPLLVPVLAAVSASAPELANGLRHAATWIALVVLSLGLVRVWADPEDARRTWVVLAWAGALAGAWTLLDAALRGAPGVGPFGRTGVAGPVLAALLPSALLLVRGSRGVRILVPALVAAGCLATASRVGIVALAAGVLVSVFVAAPRKGRAKRVGLVAVVLLSVLGIGLAGAALLKVPTGGTTLAVRVGLWKATSALVWERPLVGHGTASFPAEILRVRDVEEAALSRGRRPMVAHNDVLHASAEGGVPAGLALALWMVAILALGVGAWRRVGGAPVAAALGAFVALAVSALGEDVLLDPAGALLAACAAAALVTLGTRAATKTPRGVALLLAALALASLGAASVKARDLLADRHLQQYRDVLLTGPDAVAATQAAQEHLVAGVLRWRPAHPEASFRLGVHRADLMAYVDARHAWRDALAADPGMTEAWLNTAKSYEAEERYDDARDALLEARRRDPTRYDVHMRLGHLALGPEPVPRERSGDRFDPLAAHRHYNAAERAAPDRFETWVARSRIERRLGRIEEAGAMLRDADARSPKAPEILLESFRLTEVEGVPDAVGIRILGLALLAAPELAVSIRQEADRFLAEGRIREEAAKRKVRGTLDAPDYQNADRAFEAAARRYAALLHARVLEVEDLIRASDEDVEIKGHRAALARLLALLTWATPESPELGKTRAERLRAMAEIRLRAARAAVRIDATQAKAHYAEAHKTEAAYFVEVGDWPAARGMLKKAKMESPNDASIHLALARALVHTDDLDAGEEALLEALRLQPDLKAAVALDETLAPLRTRPLVADALR